MKKTFALIICTLVLLTGCAGEKDSHNTNSMRYKKVLVVGIDDEFAPLGFRDEQGNIVGFDVDLAKEAAKRIGVEFEFRPIDWENKEFEITSGNVDIIWNGCDIIDEYKEFMIFSKPYMDNRKIVLVKAGNEQDIYSVDDLTGKIVGTQAGSSSKAYINSDADLKNSFKEFKTYRSIKDGFAALEGGAIDAFIVDEIAARYEMINNPGKFDPVEATVGFATEFGIGFRKDDTELRDKVQRAFDDMLRDGTARKISEQWFQSDIIKRHR